MLLAVENTGSSIDPQRLLARVKRGDLTQLGPLLDVYRNYLTVLAAAQLDGKLQARISPSDVVQETMLEAQRDFAQFRGDSERELLGWMRKILANTLARVVEMHVLTQKRDVRREVSLRNLIAKMDQSTAQRGCTFAAHEETPSSGAQRRERAVILADVMSELSRDQQQVLVLRNMQGLKFSEVAERMNRSVDACKMLWMRSIKRVRELYEGRDEG